MRFKKPTRHVPKSAMRNVPGIVSLRLQFFSKQVNFVFASTNFGNGHGTMVTMMGKPLRLLLELVILPFHLKHFIQKRKKTYLTILVAGTFPFFSTWYLVFEDKYT